MLDYQPTETEENNVHCNFNNQKEKTYDKS